MPYLLYIFIGFLVSSSLVANAASDASKQMPPGLQQNNANPVVMLTMPRDHQLFFKAYSDYEDLDGDNIIETTFDPTISYAGYFDNTLCYKYTDDKRFEPDSSAVTDTSKSKVVNGSTKYAKYCNSGTTVPIPSQQWSGNFLNWASMTRIDILRQTFYGGKRILKLSGTNGTVLERSHIPGDAHSFAKYYAGDDLPKLTPFSNTALNCDGKNQKTCEAVQKGITLCNTTFNAAASTSTDSINDNLVSQKTTNPPLIRVAKGNFSLWAAGERIQCKFWESPEVNKGSPNMVDGLTAEAANSSTVTSSGMNQLMADIFPSATSSYSYPFYFFHDSPSVNIPSSAPDYVNTYEPNFKGVASTINTSNYSQKLGDYYARVVVCKGIFTNHCTEYTDSAGNKSSKPTGLLQRSEFSGIHWGLMTGSFANNTTGTALRKHVGPISAEIDAHGDFKTVDEGGLIPFLDNLRIVGWGFNPSSLTLSDEDKKVARSSYVGWDKCGPAANNGAFGKLSGISDGECVSWGNPLSAVLRDAYYYLSGSTIGAVPADKNYFTGSVAEKPMTSLPWSDNPLSPSATNKPATLKKCSALEVVAINSGTVSYDFNMTDLSAAKFARFKEDTKLIGDQDLATSSFFIPQTSTSGIGSLVCSPSQSPSSTTPPVDLSAVSGTCPDAPALKGGYFMAGLAYSAHTNPNFNSLYGSGVRTSAVNLAMGEPKIEILSSNSPDNKAVILPACRNTKTRGTPAQFMGSCTIVDFKVLNTLSDRNTGKYLVVWEDSQQGSDFDQDVTQIIEIKRLADNQIQIDTKVLSQSTDDPMELGFTISGVSSNAGFQRIQTINPKAYTDSTQKETRTFTIGGATTKVLPPPLSFAAKWGGFENPLQYETGKVQTPPQPSWDSKNNRTNLPGADGVPDNYIEVVNPEQLDKKLAELFQAKGPAVFTYAAIGSINTLDNGAGVSISTLFRPELAINGSSGNLQTASWLGSLTAYARDQQGFLYEDTGAKTGEYDSADSIISFETVITKTVPNTVVRRYTTPENYLNKIPAAGMEKPISGLNYATPLWSAEANLAKVANYSTQIAYNGIRSNGRYIFTAIDSDTNGLITPSGATDPTIPFDVQTGFVAAGNNLKWLNAAGDELDLVNYIRGQENARFRSRRIDFIPDFSNAADGSTTPPAIPTNADGKEPWLLGDIVNSSPLVVGSPKAGFDRDYGDVTYKIFRDKYQNRRNVVYVGANDGMLHAFNAGKSVSETGDINVIKGDELWAYVPHNLLPSLKFLSEVDYSHNYFVDGKVKFYDVNIFNKDTKHPEGWGTILVATMRTGGKPQTLNIDGKTLSLRSAIVVMDITDPESTPELIAEIPIPDGSFTNSNPDIVKFRSFNTDGSVATNNWYLALATGVTDTAKFTSDIAPKLYLFGLAGDKKLQWVDANGTEINNAIEGWVGGINSVDWNGDYLDDYIYFGTVEGTVAAPSGHLYRTKVSSTGALGVPKPVLDLGTTAGSNNRAFAATPFTVVDRSGKYWVFAGTGRYFTDEDNSSTHQNSYYAVKERVEANGDITETTSTSTLENLTDIEVLGNNSLTGSPTLTNRRALENRIRNSNGWYFDFKNVNSRNYTSTILVNNMLVFNTYEPGDPCTPYGESSQYQLDFFSGLPRARNGTTVSELPKSRVIGYGAASDPSPGNKTTTGTSLGGIDISEVDPGLAPSSRQSWRELPYSQ